MSDCGFPPDAFSEVIARINLGQEVEFRDRKGVRSRLWHDPKARRMCLQPLDPVGPTTMAAAPPLLCPNCTAVLPPWRQGEWQQTCPLCGHLISLR